MVVDWTKSGTAMLDAAKELYPKSDPGTWGQDGLVVLVVPFNRPGVTLMRGGSKQEIKSGQTFRLGRLDLIEVSADKGVTLEHPWLGTVELPAGRLVSSRALHGLLPEDARDKVKQAVADALKGAEAPADRLEKALPFAEPVLREALSKDPDRPGAPRLRLILSLFDDAVMPALAPVEMPNNVDELDRDIAPPKR
jgi:hypothetical protein